MDLNDLVARLDAGESPTNEPSFYGQFRGLESALESDGREIPPDLVSEEIAFMLHSHDRQDASAWGLYFGPYFSVTAQSGERLDSPPLSAITPDVLAYWRKRAENSANPVMRARYADLLWEMPKKLDVAKPDPDMARVAIDSYLAAVKGHRYEHSVNAIDRAKRALELALSVKDEVRVGLARDVLLALEEEIADDDSLGLWGFCFDLFVEPPNKRLVLANEQQEKLVADMEARLQRTISQKPGIYHPFATEEAATRLAHYYRRLGRKPDVARVLKSYGKAVQLMRGTSPPLLVSHSLEKLYNQFKTFELHAEADALNDPIRAAGEETLADMKQLSVSVQIPQEKVEAYFAAMLSGDAPDILSRIAIHFVPKRNEIDAQLRSIAEEAPLLSMLSRTIKDHKGRTVAEVGSVDSDADGQLVVQISNNLSFAIPWLRETMRRAFDAKLVSAKLLMDFLLASPLFESKREGFMVAGLKAYEEGDALVAIHVLGPQVEAAIRQLAIRLNAPIYAQRRGGGLNYKTLDELLRNDLVLAALGENVVLYLRVLLTDARGWNVRNDVFHGLASFEMMSLPVADRVVHALLLLALVGDDSDSPSSN